MSGAVTVGSTGELRAEYVRAGVLEVGALGKVVIKPSDAGASRVGTLLLGAGAKLDLTDNALVVAASSENEQGTVLAQLSDWIESGRNGGSWQGSGITSSVAGTDGKYTLGVMPNRDDAGQAVHEMFEGVAADENSVLVRYTLAGDLNLDGGIDASDYFLIDRGRALLRGGYWNGDVDYSGGIANADDFMRMDRNFVGQGATPVVPGAGAAVPEPGVIVMLAAPTALLMRRRRGGTR